MILFMSSSKSKKTDTADTAEQNASPKQNSSVSKSSLANLNRSGRISNEERWGEEQSKLTTAISRSSKEKLKEKVKASGYLSLPDFLEHVARGLIRIPQKPESDKTQNTK